MRAQLAVCIAAQDHRLFTHVAGDEIAGIGDFAFVAEIEPAAREETLALQLVNFTVGEYAPVDKTAFRIDKRLDIHSDSSSIK